ncbi:hypothetical protein ABOM_008862 [Aspergillus bombycis]|uniref:Heterokaryon incompatibility domain-containing protein n=1 Tax=Aspergillus bombycis TaxID=109264 RepID=A0A1F7ZUN5_9EURO|nr:hypothetical protein ABOM_008862 [Aspergillus bombycis]OGM43174.1 hypothetical protein ABOM_008862 [Aspergillus bombycis]
MGTIYNQSYLTLIAMTGSDASYGLPGTQGRQRCPQWTGQTQGIYLLQEIDDYSCLARESKWSSRGWTFQESVLSPRILVFSDQGVFYQCHRKSHYKDEDHGDQRLDYPLTQIPLSSYDGLVSEFTTRDLTYKSDILDAFSGILHFAYGVEHHYGLPFSDFSRAILWRIRDGRYPMRPPCIPKRFPSWSWSSIDNIIQLPHPMLEQAKISASLAQWVIPPRNKQLSLKILPNPSTEEHELDGDFDSDDPDSQGHLLARLAVLMAWKWGCFPGRLPKCLISGATWEQYDAIIRQRWKSLAGMTDEAYSMQGGHLPAHEQETRFPIQMQDACTDGCLMVFTQSTRLQIRENETFGNYTKLLDKYNDAVGWLIPNSINWEQLKKIPRWNWGAEFDVLALSIPYEGLNKYSRGVVYDHKAANWYDSAGNRLVTRDPCVNLMVVETKNGICRRIALAQASLKSWIKRQPQFHTFILD